MPDAGQPGDQLARTFSFMAMVKRRRSNMKKLRGVVIGLALTLGIGASGAAFAAEKDEAYLVQVENATAKVGHKGAIVAKVTTRHGYMFSESYRNRVIELSSIDDAVDFERPVVRGTVKDGAMVFKVGVTPTKVGTHPINGVFRIGFHNGEKLNMISVPLMATVTGSE